MKFTAIIFSVALAVFGASPASPVFAQSPEECAEADTRPADVDCTVLDAGGYPLELPEGGTVPETTPTTVVVVLPEGGTVPTTTRAPAAPTGGVLPKTGSGGTAGLLQVGGLLLAGGLLVFVAARRRTPATTA